MSELLVYAETEAASAFWRSLQRFWTDGFAVAGPVSFAFAVSLVWSVFYNSQFWRLTIDAMGHVGAGSAVFLGTLIVFVVTAQATLLLLLPTRRAQELAVAALFFVAALSSYFGGAYGAIFNREMMRNVLETDAAEVGGLVNADLVAHALVFGVLPALIVSRARMPASGWRLQLKRRGTALLIAWLIVIAGLFAASANYAVFFRQHKPIRYTLVPIAPLSSAVALAKAHMRHSDDGPLLNPGGAVQRVGVVGTRPSLMFLVVGETARARNFGLGGYDRSTNTYLEKIPELVYFDRATACGTSTAVSVPCMFSAFGRRQFDVDRAGSYLNLLDTLASAGIDVEWRDNNAGCKGVCSRTRTVQYSQSIVSPHCVNSYCFDEVMLEDLAQRVDSVQHDTVIVFHQIGSHGPAYAERYPPQFEIFKPVCRSSELQRCTVEEVRNAYDNSIAYSDFVLSRQIEILRKASDRLDTILIYASDHGESLGERGVYLHGMPYAFAPEDQKRVPMLMWTSPAFRSRMGLDDSCLRKRSHDNVSHDNLYHTVLGAAGLTNKIYDPQLDLLKLCRSPRSTSVAPQ